MRRILLTAALPALGLLTACGNDPSNDITVTNEGNIVTNSAQANMAFQSENEGPANGSPASNYGATGEPGNMVGDNVYGGNTL